MVVGIFELLLFSNGSVRWFFHLNLSLILKIVDYFQRSQWSPNDALFSLTLYLKLFIKISKKRWFSLIGGCFSPHSSRLENRFIRKLCLLTKSSTPVSIMKENNMPRIIVVYINLWNPFFTTEQLWEVKSKGLKFGSRWQNNCSSRGDLLHLWTVYVILHNIFAHYLLFIRIDY